ncbi:pectate lyase [Streptomyces sp. TRM 70351]|uniref:pectate lyase family protein n=1 Tax=Streptomyces sp. TRM 70351 TaxID=3116552 RepID=UPI002E7B29A9|nr:pectate lyase [Streptomyces sp. TRM 70351]MEE1928290.1 pectate lyase [Streptomyces sp. TRM 70351]
MRPFRSRAPQPGGPQAPRARRVRTASAAAGCAALALAVTAPLSAPAAAAESHRYSVDRAVLGANDGWAAAEGGTTGGSAADRRHVFTVDSWAELRAAVAHGDADTPRIIRIKGTIDAHTDAAGNALACDDYATDGYTLPGYLAAYDPDVWGSADPSGPMEDARVASARRQAAQIRLDVGSNTTLVGVGRDARLLGANVQIRGVENVIVRNLTFEDTFDCFPQWDPTDGADGAWNSEYDNLVVYGSRHVWVDHNTLTDGRGADDDTRHFGQPYQRHDGLLDIVRGADLVTVSWNVFTDHDKTLLIGNSDGAGATDRGKLRVTLHHNKFRDIGERAPRVRFGQVDTYNNHYVARDADAYAYTFGIGFESQLYAEKNYFSLPRSVPAGTVLKKWSEAPLTAGDNLVNGRKVDLIAAHNALNPDTPLRSGAGWTPELRDRVDATWAVPGLVFLWAGAGKLAWHEPRGTGARGAEGQRP